LRKEGKKIYRIQRIRLEIYKGMKKENMEGEGDENIRSFYVHISVGGGEGCQLRTEAGHRRGNPWTGRDSSGVTGIAGSQGSLTRESVPYKTESVKKPFFIFA